MDMGQSQSASGAPAASAIPNATASNNVDVRPTRQKGPASTLIERRADEPFSEEAAAASHNFGQPRRPPHHVTLAASATIGGDGDGDGDSAGRASKLITDCRAQQRASLACIEENYQNKNEACGEYFLAYKLCRREEHERRLEANARASGAW